MNIFDIINETLSEEPNSVILTEEEMINEGFFGVSPLVAMYAFKQRTFKKLENNGFVKFKDKVEGAIGTALSKKESLKAKMGLKSGKGENATIYSLTTEQRKVLAEMYNKYGKELYKQIIDFRNNVIAPYQIIKRNVANNQKLTDKEVNGMTKDEFYKYRESGRKKIEKRGTFFKDFKEQEKKVIDSREAIKKAKDKLEDFKSGKNKRIDPDDIEKILDKMNLGTNKLNNWSLDELNKTFEEINRLNKLLSDPSKINGDKVKIGYYKSTNRGNAAEYTTIDELKSKISKLSLNGISAVNNVKNRKQKDNELKRGSFAEAFATYVLRKDKLLDLKKNSSEDEFSRIYIEVLKNAIKSAEEKNKNEFGSYVEMRKDIDLNEYEKKIWGLLPTTVNKWSGDISDYYQKIKEEDFKGTKYFKKPEKVIQAEKEIDAAVKRFEREIEKTVSPEDLNKIKKYRLINNPLTVKELKDPKNMFKDDNELKDSVERKEETITSDEFREILDKYISTVYNSFKEMDEAKNRIREMRSNISKETEAENRDRMNFFLQRRTLKATAIPGQVILNKKDSSVSIEDIQNLASQIVNKEYYSSEQTENDKEKFDNLVKEFNEKNTDISQADSAKLESLRSSVEDKFNSVDKEE